MPGDVVPRVRLRQLNQAERGYCGARQRRRGQRAQRDLNRSELQQWTDLDMCVEVVAKDRHLVRIEVWRHVPRQHRAHARQHWLSADPPAVGNRQGELDRIFDWMLERWRVGNVMGFE